MSGLYTYNNPPPVEASAEERARRAIENELLRLDMEIGNGLSRISGVLDGRELEELLAADGAIAVARGFTVFEQADRLVVFAEKLRAVRARIDGTKAAR